MVMMMIWLVMVMVWFKVATDKVAAIDTGKTMIVGSVRVGADITYAGRLGHLLFEASHSGLLFLCKRVML